MPRYEAAQAAVDCGAILKTAVSGKTNYLVVGTQNLDVVGADGMSSKERKAYELMIEAKHLSKSSVNMNFWLYFMGKR